MPYSDRMEGDRLERVARKYGIALLLQFGSSVAGRTHEHSDVDLAVLLDRSSLTFEEEADLIAELQALVLDRDVDVAFLDRADPLFLKQITDQCELLYGSRRQLEQLKLQAFKRYQDHRRYLQMEREYVDRKIASLRR